MSSCTCGHHHHHPAAACDDTGTPIALDRPMIALTGRLVCDETAQMLTALTLLPDHSRLSRAEPGNLRFDLAQSEDPMVWTLDELFADAEAFAAHQARTAASDWGRSSTEIRRDFTRSEVVPHLRPETPADRPTIHALNLAAFGGADEAVLVDALRRDGDLNLSLVAAQGGTILGHLALSPISAPFPALALAPVAVHPVLHGRGIGSALIRAAIAARPGYSLILLGDPAYYSRFGFQPVDLKSPYAGPYLQALGAGLQPGATITHAPAFSALG
ncbi:GNAT family N-acetyltransferase [uncultured Paracoccus sp.]|uniref:GNAT family N-acetyltransferase n=1 Tax=uncultured Paracoccus sp. TaxID=189685 RepID=UPI002632D085|nr:GNAT family N-acetyltransferase [uncultured Paracoccus sp.]